MNLRRFIFDSVVLVIIVIGGWAWHNKKMDKIEEQAYFVGFQFGSASQHNKCKDI